MSVYAIKNLEFKEINPISAGYEQADPSYRYSQTRDYYVLHYVVSGKGTFVVNGRKYNISAGQSFLIKPGDKNEYTADAKNPWYYIWVSFDGSIAKKLDELPEPVFTAKSTTFEKIRGCLAYGSMCQIYLIGCICQILCDLFETSGNIERIMSITRWIDEHYMENLKVEDLAKMFNLDRKYLARIFKRETGFTISEYMKEVKMSAAKSYIKSGFSINETAQFIGYSDQSVFSRAFKKHFGYAPSQQRKILF